MSEGRRARQVSSPAEIQPAFVVGGMSVLFAAVMSYLSVARHLAFQSHAFDLGNMDQAVWNTAHGRFLRFTDMAAGHEVLTTRLAIHVEPLLALFAIPYLVHPSVEILLISQAVVVASGGLALYWLAADATQRRWWSLVFPLAYFAHPSLQNALLDDFHAVTLSAALLAWTLLFAYRGHMLGFALFAVLSAATKEEVGLVVALIGVWLAIRGHRRAGIGAAVLGAAWFAIAVGAIIPSANPAGHSPYLGRYAYLGHGLGGVLLSPLKHPGTVLAVLTSAPRLDYMTYLLHPLGYVSLLGLPWLLIATPALVINMLSADPSMYSGYYQYSAEIIPAAVAAAILGGSAFGRFASTRVWGASALVPILCVLVAVGSGVDTWRWGFTPAANGYVIPSAGPHQRIEDGILRRIPAGSVAAAADEIEPHLSERRWIYLLPMTRPQNGPPAQYIILDASVPSSPIKPAALRQVAVQAIRGGYGIEAADDGVLLLARGSQVHALPASFYSFAYTRPVHARAANRRFGPLTLQSFVIHPASRSINRARPAIAVETWWTVPRRLRQRPRLAVVVRRSGGGEKSVQRETDGPTLDWLAVGGWAPGRVVHVAFVPVVPDTTRPGEVEVDLEVHAGARAALTRLGTVKVQG